LTRRIAFGGDGLDDFSVRFDDLVLDVWPPQGAVVGKRGVGVGELEWGDQEVALTDREGQVVVRIPDAVCDLFGLGLVVGLRECGFPRRIGDPSISFVEFEAGRGAESEFAGLGLDPEPAGGLTCSPSLPELVAHRVEIDVARHSEGLG
jgi:hypothetical protein